MSGMSGIQLGYEARRLIPNLKVILVSGYPKPAMVAGHGDIQDFDFLRKPYRIAEVIKLLGKQI
jgi:DNA-binding NtrC family response regulator